MRTDTDLTTTRSVREALRCGIRVPDELIRAHVDGGWVWLQGHVDWEYQREAAEAAVKRVPGVRGVIDDIRVRASIPNAPLDDPIFQP